MKKLISIIFVLFIFSSYAHSENNSTNPETIPKKGLLGYELEKSLTIKGIKQSTDPNKLTHARMLFIDTVNGEKLEKPVHLYIKNVDTDSIESGTECIFIGYQSGEYIGSATGQSPRQFHHYFIVTSIEKPKPLKIEKISDKPRLSSVSQNYEILFKEYTTLVEPHVLNKDVEKVEIVSTQFVNAHKDHKIYEIYIWNKELKTKNNLLFKKTYIEPNKTTIIVYPKIHYANPRAINVSKLEQNKQKYIMIKQELDTIEYRMVIFID